MRRVLVAIVAASALLGTTMANNESPAAGNCEARCNVPLVPLTMDYFEDHRPWELYYISGSPLVNDVVAVGRDGTRIGPNVYNATDTFRKSDNSVLEYNYILSVIDNVVIEDCTIDGQRHIYKSYPMAMTTEYAVLFHRCSEDGDADTDTRFIWVSVGKTISEKSLNYLLDVDRECHFRGELHKLSDRQ